MRHIIFILFLVISGTFFAQDKIDSLCLHKRQLYVGADSIERKKIICGFYLTALESGDYELDLSIMDNWVHKDSVKTIVRYQNSFVCERALYDDSQKIEKTTCHTFTSNEGLLLTLAFQSGAHAEGCHVPKIGIIELPEDRKSYVRTLSNMYYK